MRYEIDRDLIRQNAGLEQSMAKRVAELGINDINEAYIAGTIDTFNESQIAMEKNAMKNAVIGVLTGTVTTIILYSIDERFHISERVCKKLEDRKAKRSSKKELKLGVLVIDIY